MKRQVTRDRWQGVHPNVPSLVTRHLSPAAFRAFTLIELMVAIAIGALLMLTAVPAVRAIRKPPLVRAMNDFTEGCRRARAAAILTGRTMQVVIHNGGSSIGVEPAPVTDPTAMAFSRASGPAVNYTTDLNSVGTTAEAPAGLPAIKPFNAVFPDGVAFQKLIVNLRDQMQEQAIAIKFHPNGTSDQLDAELTFERTTVMGVTLEVVTGQTSVVSIR